MTIDRRAFLGTIALAPAALAACAGASGRRGAGASAATAPAPPPAPETGLAAVRSFPLPAGAEPALVFRAVAARPGER